MSTTTQVLTADDLWNLPDHGGRCELVRGELRPMSPAGFDHGSVTARLTILLGHYVISQKLGEILAAETGFIVSRDPDTVRAPDLAFVRKDRIPRTGRPQKYWVGAPDLVVETMSPSDTVLEVDEKVQEWLAAGAALVWVVNPRQKKVTVYRPDMTARILGTTDTLSGDDVVSGFTLPVAEVFA